MIEDVDYTASGYIQAIAPDGTVISRHRQEREAQQACFQHAKDNEDLLGDGVHDYILRSPDVRMSIRLLSVGGNPTNEDTTPPDPPAGVFNNSVTSSGFVTNWTNGPESDLQEHQVYRSTVGPSSGFVPVGSPVSVPSNSYSHSGLSAETQYWVYVTALDSFGNESAASSVVSSTTSAATSDTNAARILALLNGRTPPFTINYPSDPVTTREVTVTSASSFNNEASTAGTLINIGASFSGDINITADDIDVVCSNAFTVTGNLNIPGTARNRIRWTGGNLNGFFDLARTFDFLFDDVYFTTPNSSSFNTFGGDGRDRHAMINCTIEKTNGSNINAWHLYTFNSSDLYNDFIIGNCLFTGSSTDQSCVRMQGCERILVVDCVFNPLGNQIHGLRFHDGCQSVWVKDSWIRDDFKIDSIGSPTNPSLPNCGNALFDNVTVYNIGSTTFTNFTDSTPQGSTVNSGTCTDCTYRPENPYGSFTLPTGFSDGGGNTETAWDGSTLPDYSAVGALRP